MYPARGEVVWSDGTPATELAVGFISEAARISARGEINPDGTFTLSSLKKDDGLPPGTYLVIVAPPVPNSSDDRAGPEARGRRMFPRKYQSYSDSGLTVTVEAKSDRVRFSPRGGSPMPAPPLAHGGGTRYARA
jgi:hypothetical protein